LLLTLLMGFSFGGNFVTYAADTCNIWGVAKLDIVYPAVSTAYGIAGIAGPITGGMIRDATGSYSAAVIAGIAVCSAGIAAYALLMPRHNRLQTGLKKYHTHTGLGIPI
jgi:OFA family oxalate/formate antiporter-like MFS transporter